MHIGYIEVSNILDDDSDRADQGGNMLTRLINQL